MAAQFKIKFHTISGNVAHEALSVYSFSTAKDARIFQCFLYKRLPVSYCAFSIIEGTKFYEEKYPNILLVWLLRVLYSIHIAK